MLYIFIHIHKKFFTERYRTCALLLFLSCTRIMSLTYNAHIINFESYLCIVKVHLIVESNRRSSFFIQCQNVFSSDKSS